MDESSQQKTIWNQCKVPVILRRERNGQKLRVRLPFAMGNRSWLQNNRRSNPAWVDEGNYWEVPKSWFNDFVERSLRRYGRVYIFQPYRKQEKCAPACQNAVGHECQCSCMGENHGAGSDASWFEVSETFSFRWRSQELACRLLTARNTRFIADINPRIEID